MKGLRNASDLYAPARPQFINGACTDTDWRELLDSVGDQRKRLWFLGDRLLDRLEARLLRDQLDIPPGLVRLVNEYRALFLLPPVAYRTSIGAHDSILDVQARLVPRDPRPLRRRKRRDAGIAKGPRRVVQ